ncbi:hypothetical protein HK405_004527 [Cladochytrium tenue]|nr:hypothetical protein HK405_004527 [Cladochytrium tenue]
MPNIPDSTVLGQPFDSLAAPKLTYRAFDRPYGLTPPPSVPPPASTTAYSDVSGGSVELTALSSRRRLPSRDASNTNASAYSSTSDMLLKANAAAVGTRSRDGEPYGSRAASDNTSTDNGAAVYDDDCYAATDQDAELGENDGAADDAADADSIYDVVDAVVPRSDDPATPALTFRVFVIGTVFGVALAVFNATMKLRLNSFVSSICFVPPPPFLNQK